MCKCCSSSRFPRITDSSSHCRPMKHRLPIQIVHKLIKGEGTTGRGFPIWKKQKQKTQTKTQKTKPPKKPALLLLWVQKQELGQNYYCLFCPVPLIIWCFKALTKRRVTIRSAPGKAPWKEETIYSAKKWQESLSPSKVFIELAWRGWRKIPPHPSAFCLARRTHARTAESVPHQYPSSKHPKVISGQ